MTAATTSPGIFSVVQRIRTILTAIFFAAMGHGAMFVLLPTNMSNGGVSVSTIGMVMACYSVGVLTASFFGHKLIQAVGHNRVYSAMAAIVSILVLLHMFFEHTLILALFRYATGVCLAIMFVTLESWLSFISDRNSRGFIYSFYQVCFGMGFMLAPFVANILPGEDVRSFGLVAILMSCSLLPLLLTRRPSPALEGDQRMLSIVELMRDSPTTCVGTITAGMMVGSLLSLITIYLLRSGYEASVVSPMFSAILVGSLLFQIPVGKLVDLFDKKLVFMVLCVQSLICVSILFVTSTFGLPWWVLLAPLLLFGGALFCMHPLTVTLLFEQVESDKAVAAMGAMITMHTSGQLLGPIIIVMIMEFFGDDMLLGSILVLQMFLLAFVIYRKYHSKKRIDRESIPYMISLQSIRSTTANLDPRLDNLVQVLNSSSLRALASSIALMPRRTLKLITASKEIIDPDPDNSLESLVLLKPKRSYEIVSAMVNIYPDRRMGFVEALGDIIVLNKQLINQLLLDGLCHGANKETTHAIHERFKQIVETEEGFAEG